MVTATMRKASIPSRSAIVNPCHMSIPEYIENKFHFQGGWRGGLPGHRRLASRPIASTRRVLKSDPSLAPTQRSLWLSAPHVIVSALHDRDQGATHVSAASIELVTV